MRSRHLRLSAQNTQTHPVEALTEEPAGATDWRARYLAEKRAREQAEAQARQLNDALAGLGDGLALLDADLRYLYVNPFTLQLMGRTREEVLGQSFYDLYPDLVGTPYEEALRTALQEQRPVATDVFYPKNGRYWRTRIHPTAAGLTIYFQDVTELKATEVIQQRLAAIIESSDDAIIAKTLDGIITDWNPAAERMFGYTSEEAVGKPMTILFPPDRLDEERQILERLRQGIATDHFETIRVRKDGVPLHVSQTISPVRNGAGRIIGASTIARDITERRYFAEERRYVMAGAHCLLWHAFIEERGDPNRLHWTIHLPEREAAQRFLPLALKEGEVYQDAWYRCRLPEDGEASDRLGTAAVRSGQSYRHEFRIRRADGCVRWIHEDVSVETLEPGKQWRAIAVCTDITERKQLELRLREETETLEIIHRLGQQLSAELELEKLVQAATDAATQLTGAQFGAFFYNVVNPAGESYRLYTLSGAPREAFAQFPMPRNTAVFALTFAGKGTVRLDDVTQDPRYGKNAPYYGKPPGHLPVVSYLAVPVVSRSGEVLGGLFFGHEQPGVFTERHERIVEGLAAQAAIAIDNARLFQAERERSEQLSIAISEVHHRVKNSLQSVGALLEMQIPEGAGSIPVEAVQDSLSQIKTIALVHDLLARDKPIHSVDAAQVLTNLGRLLSASMSAGPQQTRIGVQAEAIEMSTKTATALALAVNELLTNAAKHDNTVREGGLAASHDADTIQVVLQRDGDNILVSVQDSGPGFPPDFDPARHASIGLQLVQTLVGFDLHGAVRFENVLAPGDSAAVLGGRAEIVFPASVCAEE
ncbi:MAG TPA: PAS domain S-box protein [Chthonomonadaceae bacterium]|nr:PAS domain S-box protein [Chthonomonadaceae bacterium]